jgi:lambda family phage portal protein
VVGERDRARRDPAAGDGQESADGTLDKEPTKRSRKRGLTSHAGERERRRLALAHRHGRARDRDEEAGRRSADPDLGRLRQPHAYSLQILDADVLDHTYNEAARRIRTKSGWASSATSGAPVAYWLWTVHPTTTSTRRVRERVRVPANEIIHLYTVKRPGQTRGITAFAPVMSDINMLGGYQEAELVAARGAAANMGFIIEDEEAEGEDPDTPTSIPTEAEPGTFQDCRRVLKLQQYSPEHPVAAFGAFVRSILRSIASGLSVAYSRSPEISPVPTTDPCATARSKSATRTRKEQNWIAIQLYRRVYLQWMKYAIARRRAQAADAQHGALHLAQLARARLAVDRSEKDIKAAAMEVAYGFNTRTKSAPRTAATSRRTSRHSRTRKTWRRARRRARHRRPEDSARHEHRRRRTQPESTDNGDRR